MPHLAIAYPPPSHYDIKNGNVPFSGAAGRMFVHRTLDTIPDLTYTVVPHPLSKLPPATHVLLLGEEACNTFLGDRNVNKHRGYRKTVNNIPAIVTYSHMDCWNFKDDEEDKKEEGNDKDVGVTRRSNYLYWALTDFKKLFAPPRQHSARLTDLNPSPLLIADLLDRAPDGLMISLDIETRPQDNTLDCIGFGFYVKSTWYLYSLRIYGPDNLLCHSQADLARFYRAFYKAILNPKIIWVGHNLAFDFSVLTHHYSLPFPRRIHDTMLSMHRDNPFVDKSLSHAISRYTDAKDNHKGNFIANTTPANFQQLLIYNADDVYWTGEVAIRQKEILPVAILDQVNSSQYVCLVMSFTGITIDEAALARKKEELTLKTAQLLRVIRILIGNPEFNPNSTQQIAAYFYDTLTYEPPALTDSGAPAADEKSLLKLQLKQTNPLIPLIIAYKGAAKELSTLNFTPYARSIPRS